MQFLHQQLPSLSWNQPGTVSAAMVLPSSGMVGNLHGINGSGRAPAAWSPERFAGLEEMPKYGWDSVTVPGAVSIWSELSQRFGKLPFAKLFKPAIRYGVEGFPVSPITAGRWAEAADLFRENDAFKKTFLLDGRAPFPGELFYLPDSADTLAEIAATGGVSFYRGDLARLISAESAKQGGALTFADLSAHRAEWVKPLHKSTGIMNFMKFPQTGRGLQHLSLLVFLIISI